MDPRLQDYIIDRIEKLDEKVDQLLAFKWQMVGGSAAVSLVVAIAIQLIFK